MLRVNLGVNLSLTMPDINEEPRPGQPASQRDDNGSAQCGTARSTIRQFLLWHPTGVGIGRGGCTTLSVGHIKNRLSFIKQQLTETRHELWMS